MNGKEFVAKYKSGLVAAGIVVGSIPFLVFTPSCVDKQQTAITSEIPGSKDALTQIKTPFWSNTDFKDIDQKLQNGNYSAGPAFLKDPNSKPPFYKDDKPFQWINYIQQDKFYLRVVLAQEFKELNFLNVYLPPTSPGGISIGAKTLSLDTGRVRLAAEARFLRAVKDKDGSSGFEVQEVHYGKDGKPIFECVSQFDKRFYKISETKPIGSKAREYYFMWPY
jgi:hypothetical protein